MNMPCSEIVTGNITPQEVDLLGPSTSIIHALNKLPIPCEFRICDPGRDPHTAQRLMELDDYSYTVQYGKQRHRDGSDLIHDQFRGTEKHGPIVYFVITAPQGPSAKLLGIPHDLQGGIVAYFSIFQNLDKLLFTEYKDSYNDAVANSDNLIDENIPRFVISKLVRDPQFRPYMNRLLSPHRILLAAVINELALDRGFLLEEQAQPASQRILRPALNTMYFGDDYLVLYPPDIYDAEGEFIDRRPDSEIPAIPMLVFYPPTTRRNLLRIATLSLSSPLKRALTKKTHR